MLITFEQFKTYYNALIQKLKGFKGNWNQNDPTADDYIKGRTHYSEIKSSVEYFSNSAVIIENGWAEYNASVPCIKGQEYTVIFNDISYNLTLRQIQNFYFLGNLAYLGESDGIDEEVPFGVLLGDNYAVIFAENGTYSISIIGNNVEIVHKIDEKYLPEMNLIGAEGTAEGAEIFNDYYNNKASGEYSHAEGSHTVASDYWSHAEGYGTTANGSHSHAEGNGTTADGSSSHAEGQGTTASLIAAHAEGFGTYAGGGYSHAEGYYTRVRGSSSHAEGYYTLASSSNQHVQGKYNVEDTANKYAHIVGNGNGVSTSARSNAHTIDWNGNAWFAGDIKVGGTSQDDVNAKSISDLVDIGLATSTNDGLMSSTDKVKVDSIILNPTDILVKNIHMIDQVNDKTYVVQMRNGNLVSTCVPTLTVATNPTKMTYYDGDYLDTEGMVLTLTYDDGTTKEITEEITTTSVSMSNNVATIEYIENGITISTTLEVTVVEFDPAIVLVDFNYTDNGDGTYTITGWKQTLNGVASTEMVIPNNSKIIV